MSYDGVLRSNELWLTDFGPVVIEHAIPFSLNGPTFTAGHLSIIYILYDVIVKRILYNSAVSCRTVILVILNSKAKYIMLPIQLIDLLR